MGENLLRNRIFYRLSQKIRLSSHLKNHQNFKGEMDNEHSTMDSGTLRERKEATPEDSVLFRSDFRFFIYGDSLI